MHRKIFYRAYSRLAKHFGPLHWWPAKTDFETMVGAILTQNTSWKNVEKAVFALRQAGLLQPDKMAKIGEEELANLIRSSGYYNQKARKLKALLSWFHSYGYSVQRVKASFSSDNYDVLRQDLLSIYGVGKETADSILCYAFGLPYFVADAYAFRCLGRYAPQEIEQNYESLRKRIETEFMACFPGKELASHFNEFHALLVYLGKHICKKREPLCGQCPLHKDCEQKL